MNGDVNGATVNNGDKLFFYNTKHAYSLKIPETKEVWVKLDVILSGANANRIYASTEHNNTVGINMHANGTFNDWNGGNSASTINFNTGALSTGTEYEFMLHCKADKAAGLKEIYINGLLDKSYTGNTSDGSPFNYIEVQSDSVNTLFRNLIVADFDISDYHIAPAEIRDFTTDFEKQADGSLKATTAGQYITMHLDSDDLEKSMKKVVDNPEIVGVNVGAFNVGYDSSKVNALKLTVDNADAGTTKIVNKNVAGGILLTNPTSGQAWGLDELKNGTFKLTAEKV